MATRRLTFAECENHNDLQEYSNDIESCGATITNETLNVEIEEGYVEFEVDDYDVFLEKFKLTNSYEFSNIIS